MKRYFWHFVGVWYLICLTMIALPRAACAQDTGYYAQQTYTASGSSPTFGITFPYIAQTDIQVYVATVLQAPTAYTFPDSTHVTLNVTPTAGQVVQLRRASYIGTPDSIFHGGALSSIDLNGNANQSVYGIQETQDGITRAVISGGGGSGSVTSVTCGTGLTGGTITTTGTCAVNAATIPFLAASNTFSGTQTFTNRISAPACTGSLTGLVPSGGTSSLFLRGDCTWVAPAGSGTVTSITAGTDMTGGTITSSGTIGLGANVAKLNGFATYTGQNTYTNPQTLTDGTSSSTQSWLRFVPTDFGASVAAFAIAPNGPNAWKVEQFNSTTNAVGTLDFQVASLTLNGSPLLTSAGTGFAALGGANAFTSTNSFSATTTFTGFTENEAGTATCNCGFSEWVPSNYGTGKPSLGVSKDTTASSWTIGLFDGTSNAGTINFSAGQLNLNANVTIPGNLTVASCSGCGGGGGGGSVATVYDMAGTYGADPTGVTSVATAFANAMSACAATNGGILLFRAGTFNIPAGGLNDNVTGCNIKGMGPQATNFVYHGTTGNAINVNAYNVNVSELAIFNAGSWTSGYGLAVGVSAGASLGLYNDLYFAGLPGFIYVTGASESKFTNIYGVQPTGVDAYRCDGAGATQVFGTRWNNVALGYNSTNTTTNGFHMGSGCNTWALSQVSSSGAGGGSGDNCLLVDSGTAFLILDDFECDHSVHGGTIQGGTGIQMANTWFGSTLSGNGLTFTTAFSGFASVTNSHNRDNAGSGILINGSGGVDINGGVYSGNGTAGVNVGAGVSNFKIGNIQTGVPGDPTQTYSVLINSGASNYYDVHDVTSGPTNSNGVVDGGAGAKKSVHNNYGP